MGESSKFQQALKAFSEKIKSLVEELDVAIITHLGADGITSGSIIALALIRLGGKCSLRTISDLDGSVIQKLKAEDRDFYIITDMGAGKASELRKAFDDKWLVIDHHQIPQAEVITDDEDRILNSWKYGINGSTEICSGVMAYMIASILDSKNRDLSGMAVMSAVADRQDRGHKKSLTGINSEILKTAHSMGLISTDLDIMLTGREWRPLYEALAHTPTPYIKGLTWSTENCYNLLKDTNIKMKTNGRWRVISEISQEEKSTILDAVVKFIVTSNPSVTPSEVMDALVGCVYTLMSEDKRSQLRDARDFSTMLNACGRTGKSGVGIAICMGDRNIMLTQGEQIVCLYTTTLRSYLSTLFSEKWRIADEKGGITFVNGEGIIQEEMLEAVSSMLGESPSLFGKLICVGTISKDGSFKFSSRKCLGCTFPANLGLIMRSCSERFHGNGGGHHDAASCRIPFSALHEFMSALRSLVNG